MDIQDEDMKIRELFRQKLENAEVIPDPSVGVNLMKRVGRQEFLRFDPSRFNVYYLGAIFVAGITAGIVFSSGGTETAQLTPPEQIAIPVDSTGNESVQAANVITPEATVEEKTVSEPLPRAIADTGSPSVNKVAQENNTAKRLPSITDSLSPSVKAPESEKAKPAEKVVEYSKYQEGFRTVVPKMNYTKRNTPAPKEKVVIKPVVIEDSVITKEIVDNVHPSKDILKGEPEKKEPVAKATATEGCPPLKVEFKNDSGTGVTSKWTFEDSVISREANPTWVFKKEGEYLVKLQNDNNLSETGSSILITVYPEPVAAFESTPAELHPGDVVAFSNKSLNAVTYSWDFGDGSTSDQSEPVHKFKKAGSYNVRLVVTSDFGCTDTAAVTKVVIKGKEE